MSAICRNQGAALNDDDSQCRLTVSSTMVAMSQIAPSVNSQFADRCQSRENGRKFQLRQFIGR